MKLPAAMLGLALSVSAVAQGVAAQGGGTSGMSSQARAVRCPKPESPRSRTFECNGVEPDWERTLSAEYQEVRRDLAALGLTPTFSYAGAYFGNISNPPHEGSYGGGLHASLNVDLAKLAGASGLSAYVGVWWMQASNADALVNANAFPANGNFVGNGVWLGQLYVQRALANGDLTIAAGRLGPGATFATLPVLANYASATANPNPVSLALDDPALAPLPPGTQWGVQLLYDFAPAWRVAAGVFDNNPESAAGKDHGLDWRWRDGNRGALGLAQLEWHRNQGAKDTGMPGLYTLGAWWDGNDFATIDGSPPTERSNRGLYAMAQQQVTRPDGPGTSRGLTLWGALTYSARANVNAMPVFAAAGASWQGPLASRPADVVAVGWYYGRFSARITPPATWTSKLELVYQCAINAAVNVALDAQYLFRLDGYRSPGTAVVGAQIELVF